MLVIITIWLSNESITIIEHTDMHNKLYPLSINLDDRGDDPRYVNIEAPGGFPLGKLVIRFESNAPDVTALLIFAQHLIASYNACFDSDITTEILASGQVTLKSLIDENNKRQNDLDDCESRLKEASDKNDKIMSSLAASIAKTKDLEGQIATLRQQNADFQKISNNVKDYREYIDELLTVLNSTMSSKRLLEAKVNNVAKILSSAIYPASDSTKDIMDKLNSVITENIHVNSAAAEELRQDALKIIGANK